MNVSVGWQFMGTVDEVAGQSVQTNFLVVGAPLFPLESQLVLEETEGGVRGIRIPLSWKSVLLAYARMLCFAAALLGWMWVLIEGQWSSGLPVVLGLLALGIWLVAGTKRPGRRERARRQALWEATGLSAPPAILPLDVAQEILAKLEAEPVYGDCGYGFALALYEARVNADAAAAERAETIWSNYEREQLAPAGLAPG
jgi:hypothetical protein